MISSIGKNTIIENLKDFSKQWSDFELKSEKKLQGLSQEQRSFIELQKQVYQMGMKTEVVSRVGDMFARALNRLQQMAGG